MPHPNPLPPSLTSGGFRIAAARAAGVDYQRLRRQDLRRPAHGIRIPAALEPRPDERFHAILHRLGSDAFLSHWSAAEVWGFRLDEPTGIHVAKAHPARAPHATGLIGHSLRLHDTGDVVRRGGLRVTAPERTWLDLAADGATTEQLIVAGDRLLWRRDPLTDLESLERLVRTAGRMRGVRALREALGEIDGRSDSRPETRLRLGIVAAGMPCPALAYRVYDDDGRFLATADAAFPAYRIALEYEGDHHRTNAAQWGHDLDRFNRYQRAGWTPLRIGAAQFRALLDTLDLIHATLLAHGWRP